jgi:hypothetical protein
MQPMYRYCQNIPQRRRRPQFCDNFVIIIAWSWKPQLAVRGRGVPTEPRCNTQAHGGRMSTEDENRMAYRRRRSRLCVQSVRVHTAHDGNPRAASVLSRYPCYTSRRARSCIWTACNIELQYRTWTRRLLCVLLSQAGKKVKDKVVPN